MRLVISIAARFRHYGLSMADLIQEGHIGLLEAAARFEPDREVRFSTYATWWIRASIQDYILRNWSIVRGGTPPPRRRSSSISGACGRSCPAIRERLATDDDLSRDRHGRRRLRQDVAVMDSRLSAPDASLNAPVAKERRTLPRASSFLVDDKPLPDEVVEDSIDGERRITWLQRRPDGLSDRELRIVRARRLSDDADTLESLGERLGISKERVRQIENRALDKLRAP